MTRVLDLASIRPTASRAASSGRQRMATSTLFRSSRRAARILALFGRNADKLNILAGFKPVADLQAGGSRFAIYENRGHGGVSYRPWCPGAISPWPTCFLCGKVAKTETGA